jgi:hypothetical protein
LLPEFTTTHRLTVLVFAWDWLRYAEVALMFLLIWIRSEVQKAWLTGAKRREWMGMDGLLGLLIVSQWIPENSLRLALRLVPPGHFWDLFHPMR